MSWARRFLRIAAGDTAMDTYDRAEDLEALHRGFLARSRGLAVHAELAPTPAARAALTVLAGEDAARADTLREALNEVGIWVHARPAPVPAPQGASHWERIVHDLEAHRAARKSLLELAVHFAESEAPLAAVLAGLARDEAAHAGRLRDLIALADPQALD